MKLEIVVHCWRYSRMLAYQLSSLVLFPPKDVEVALRVFGTYADIPTMNMIDYFRGRYIPFVLTYSCQPL